jgi:actin-related protein
MNVLPDPNRTLVYDLGGYSIKFGFAGDAQPIFCIPSSYVTRELNGEQEIKFGDQWITTNQPNLEVSPLILDNGILAPNASDALQVFLETSYSPGYLNTEPEEHPALFNMPAHLLSSKVQFDRWRRELCSQLFEFGRHPAVCLEYDATLAALSRGVLKAGVVVDFGWSNTRIVPILDGKPYVQAMKLNQFGVSHISDFIHKVLIQQKYEVYSLLDPPPMVSTNGFIVQMFAGPAPRFEATDSQRRYLKKNIIIDILKNHLNITLTQKVSTDPNSWQYDMPGRGRVDVSYAMQQAKTIFWSPQKDVKALPDSISESIHNCPGDVRRSMWMNIIPCGGFSSVPGMYDKLFFELKKYVPKNYTVEIKQPFTDPLMQSICTGQFSTWCGGSILGSFDKFSDFCITKQEWEEHGEAVFESKKK